MSPIGVPGALPAISVLLPCRNASEHLPEAIRSLRAQSFQDFEVIAVDDGSHDETAAQLAGWALRDRRVRVLRGEARGIAAALATALAAARAPLIARMDADDVAEPHRFERQLTLLAAKPNIAACGARIRYFPRATLRDGARRYEAWINSLTEPQQIAREIFVECPIPHPTLMIRRDAILAVGGYRDPGWPEDYDLCLRLWANGFRMANVPEVLLHWREHATRASRSDERYHSDAFRRCKVHFLRSSLLARRNGAVVWGGGPIGKKFALELIRQDVNPRAFVDLDRRKIGQQIHGAPVIAPHSIHRFRDALVLAAVGSPGARSDIRHELLAAGWIEGVEFCAVA